MSFASQNSLGNSIRALLALAGPVVASQASSMLVNIADTVMTGRLGDAPLAAVSFASNISVPLMFMGIGIASTITPLIGRRLGRKDLNSIALLIHEARRLNWRLVLTQLLLLTILYASIPHMGQPDEIVPMSQGYLAIITLSFIGQQMFVCCRTILEGLQDTSSPMRIGVIGNILNIVLNYFLIFGIGSWNGLGVYGAALSTLIARTLMWLSLEVVLRHKLRSLGIVSTAPPKSLWRRLLFIGLPVGTQSLVECLGFAFAGIMMGWISTEAIAAHQVVNLFTSMTYLMSGGVATAVTIKVSVACGANNPASARQFTLLGLAIVTAFMTTTALCFVLFRDALPALVINSPAALEIASQLMIVGALFQLFDGLQITSIGALRGYADFSYPAKAAAIAFACVGIPVGYVSAFVFNLGAPGIWIGLASGLFVAAVLLLFRLAKRIRTVF